MDLNKNSGMYQNKQGSETIMLPTSVDIEFEDITLEVQTGFFIKKKKTILKSLSGSFKSGELTAIMGPSGAGKSSLLNTLTGFSTKGIKGVLKAGDSICRLDRSKDSLRKLRTYRRHSCYILQDDRLNPLFTVKELMHFGADLKLGNTMTQEKKRDVIAKTLSVLGLANTENTKCCNLSGGQRKRLSIAVELIDNPPVIFLDEPTTGLDSNTSTQCILMLKELASMGRTVIFTIHQPSATIYQMFDQVYILADGVCVYNGAGQNTVPHLASLGLICPKYHNPADYVLELANGEYGELNQYLASKCYHHTFKHNYEYGNYSKHKKDNTKKYNLELYRFYILLMRCLVQIYRDWTALYLKIFVHLAVGLLLGLLFDKAGYDASKSLSNLGFFLISLVYLSYTALMPAILRFPAELPVLKKENFNNWYQLNTYYAAVLTTSIPLQILLCAVYSAPSYMLTGQPYELTRFSMFVAVLVCVTLVSDALGNVIGTILNPVNGTFVGAIILCVMLTFAGFLVIYSHMVPVMQVISFISFLKYGFEAITLAMYSNGRASLICPQSSNYCHLSSPKEILKTFSFAQGDYWFDVGVLLVMLVVLRVVAFYTLQKKIKTSN